YLLRQFLSPFLVSVFAFSVIILVIQVFDELHYVMQQKPGFLISLEYYLLKIPGLLTEIIPIAVLMAVLFSLGNLSKLSELIAMRAGGVSIFRVTAPLLFCGALVFLGTLLFNEVVVPKANYLERQIRWNDIERRPQVHLTAKSNISLMDADNEMLHIGHFDGTTNTMTDIIVIAFSNGIQIKSRIDAEQARYVDGQWVFKNGYFRAFDDTGAEISCKPFSQAAFPLPQKPEDFLKDETQPGELNLVQLYSIIQQLKQSGSDNHRELVEFHKKIAVPFACVILALLGVPWGWSLGKYSGVASSFGICLLVAFAYIGGMQIFQTLGTSGTLSPFVAMWVANVLFGLGGLWLLFSKNR
ncbi:MAG TPA: LPS export ABC transporter permease LptG, partial [bacterium]|nr:LPS export ABC transporter permease LptG [bacterium]